MVNYSSKSNMSSLFCWEPKGQSQDKTRDNDKSETKKVVEKLYQDKHQLSELPLIRMWPTETTIGQNIFL